MGTHPEDKRICPAPRPIIARNIPKNKRHPIHKKSEDEKLKNKNKKKDKCLKAPELSEDVKNVLKDLECGEPFETSKENLESIECTEESDQKGETY